jgi:hypothetical protein
MYLQITAVHIYIYAYKLAYTHTYMHAYVHKSWISTEQSFDRRWGIPFRGIDVHRIRSHLWALRQKADWRIADR